MKAGWQEKAIGDVCEIKPSKGEARALLKPKDLVSFVPMEDLPIGSKDLKLNQQRPLADVVGGYTYFANGDVLLAKITPCFENGKLGIATNLTNGIGFGSSEYLVLRPDSSITSEWLYYYLSRESFRREGASRMAGAVGHKRVPQEFVARYPIPVPPLSEQKRIVAILDEAFEAIEVAKRNAKNSQQSASEIFDSFLAELEAQKVQLGDLVDIRTGKLDANAAIENGAYPFFTCAKEIYAINEFAFDCEAILLAGNNAVGDFNVKHYRGKFNAYQRTYVITVKDGVPLTYRHLYFQLVKNLKTFKAASVGSGTKFLKLPMIRGLPISLPTLSEQLRITGIVDKIAAYTEQLRKVNGDRIDRYIDLRNSILSEAYSGSN